MLIVDPVERARIDSRVVAAALALSPAETQIAIPLAEAGRLGRSRPRTGRGRSTVRTHLKHIFIKLGVSRQLDVAQLVLARSSLPRSQD